MYKRQINDYLCDTIASVFKDVYTVPVDGGTNMEVFASNEAGLPEMLKKNTEKLTDGEIKGMMETVYTDVYKRQIIR